ncbi:selenoprotein W-related protein, partial [Escherichia coli]|nr:selenoprotein W-related protein [Escherichia coli]
ASKGEFRILVSGVQVWDRVVDDGFPEAKEIKQRVRDVIAPERDLGHSDRKAAE